MKKERNTLRSGLIKDTDLKGKSNVNLTISNEESKEIPREIRIPQERTNEK